MHFPLLFSYKRNKLYSLKTTHGNPCFPLPMKLTSSVGPMCLGLKSKNRGSLRCSADDPPNTGRWDKPAAYTDCRPLVAHCCDLHVAQVEDGCQDLKNIHLKILLETWRQKCSQIRNIALLLLLSH